MSSLFINIVQHARMTFESCNAANLAKNMQILTNLVNDLKFRDLNLNPDLVSKKYFSLPGKAPCTFVDILENDRVTMSVFILAENYTMPLHNHPFMTGILKCIWGTFKIQSFTPTEPSDPKQLIEHLYKVRASSSDKARLICKVEEPKVLNVDSEVAILNPVAGNFHQISAVGGPVAFFDILSPPYSTRIDELPQFSRKCSFFKILEENRKPEDSVTLEKIPAPLDYYCDNILYELPDSCF